MMFIDANGRLGSSTSKLVGAGGFKQEQDHNGGKLHSLLLATGLAIPSTFAEPFKRDWAWRSAMGHAA